VLPALELAYIFQGITHAPRGVIVRRMLPEVDAALRELGVLEEVVAVENASGVNGKGKESSSEKVRVKTTEKEWKARERGYHGGKGYWDDYCLVMFLRGVCMRYVAYPVRSRPLRVPHIRADAILFLSFPITGSAIGVPIWFFFLCVCRYDALTCRTLMPSWTLLTTRARRLLSPRHTPRGRRSSLSRLSSSTALRSSSTTIWYTTRVRPPPLSKISTQLTLLHPCTYRLRIRPPPRQPPPRIHRIPAAALAYA
jgi:hypothetical protein